MSVKVKELQKQIKRKPVWYSYLMLTVVSFIYAVCAQYFTLEAQIYTPGFGGLSSGLSYVVTDFLHTPADNLASAQVMYYWIFYLLCNIPVILIMWNKYKKEFWIRTCFVFFVSFIFSMILAKFAKVQVIPQIDEESTGTGYWAIYTIRVILLGGMGGGLFGIAVGMALANGGCTAGFDPITKYLAREKGVDLSKVLFILGIATSFVFIIFRMATGFISLNNGIAQITSSLVFLVIYSWVAGLIYSVTKKLEISVTSKKIDELSEHFNKINYHRSHTISNVIGGYSKQEYKMLKMTINTEELPDVVEDIVQVDPNSFITILELSEIYDLHDWTPKTKEDKKLEQLNQQRISKKVEKKNSKPVNKEIKKGK